MKRITSALISILIAGLMVLAASSCGNKNVPTPTDAQKNPETGISVSQNSEITQSPSASEDSVTTVGEGKNSFSFTVTDENGKQSFFNVNTDETVVGKALINVGLIDGEDGPYGLYVKTVNGTTLDYDTHGKYWAFYVDGTLSSVGVDMTDITEGTSYEFKAE